MASTFEFLKHPLKLISSLFEAPPSFVLDSTQGSTATPVVLNQVTAPQGICGWIPSETGTPDWVCQAFGNVMPGIVFFVSMTVVTLTLIFVIWYVLRSRAVAAELKKLSKVIAENSISSAQLLESLKKSGESLPPLMTLAQKIETLLLQTDPQSPLLSQSVRKLVDKNEELYLWTGKSLADEIPNWLTALGLLTTFIAILLGLQHVHVLSNLEVQGIGGLVNGLSGKFFSSIVALSCALSITIINYFQSGKIKRLWQMTLNRLEILLPHQSVESLLLDFIKEQKAKK